MVNHSLWDTHVEIFKTRSHIWQVSWKQNWCTFKTIMVVLWVNLGFNVVALRVSSVHCTLDFSTTILGVLLVSQQVYFRVRSVSTQLWLVYLRFHYGRTCTYVYLYFDIIWCTCTLVLWCTCTLVHSMYKAKKIWFARSHLVSTSFRRINANYLPCVSVRETSSTSASRVSASNQTFTKVGLSLVLPVNITKLMGAL
jgi:hypothetical protein